MLVIVNVALPVLVRTTDSGVLTVPTNWLPKVRLGGDKLTAGNGVAPVPATEVIRGEPGALSVTVMAPILIPRTVGVKVALITQLKPIPRVEGETGQLFA